MVELKFHVTAVHARQVDNTMAKFGIGRPINRLAAYGNPIGSVKADIYSVLARPKL